MGVTTAGRGKARQRRRRWLRLVWLGLLGVVVVLGAALGLALVWLNSSTGLRTVVGRGLTSVNGALDGQIIVADASGHLLSRFELIGVSLQDGAGDEVVGVERLEVRWRPWSLVHGHVEVREVAVHGATGALVQGPDGLNVVQIFPSGDPDAPAKEMPVSIEIREASLEGAVSFDPDGDGGRPPYRLEDVDLAGAFSMAGGRIESRIDRLEAGAVEPALGPVGLSGFVQIAGGAIPEYRIDLAALDATLASHGAVGPMAEPELDLTLQLDGLDPARLAPLVDLPLVGLLGVDLKATGPLDALALQGGLSVPRGTVHLDLTGDLESRPLTYAGSLDLDRLDLASFLDLVPTEGGPGVDLASDLSGRIEIDGSGTSPSELAGILAVDLEGSTFQSWSVDELALRATLEPELQVSFSRLDVDSPLGHAELQGRVRVPQGRFAADGTLEGVDLSAVGAQAGISDLGGTAHAQLDVRGGWADPAGFWVDGGGVLRGTGVRAPASRMASITVAFDGGYGGSGPHGTVQGSAFDAEAGGVPLQQVNFHVDLARTSASGELSVTGDDQVSLSTVALADWSRALRIVADEIHIDAYGSVWDQDGVLAVEIGEGGSIEIRGFDLRGDDGRFTAEGVIAPRGDSAFQAHAERLRLAALQPALPDTMAPLKGALGLDLSLSGPADMPDVNLQLSGAQLAYDVYGPFAVEVGIVVTNGLTSVVAAAGGPDIDPLHLQGIVPYTINLTGPRWDPGGMLQLYADVPLQDATGLAEVLPQAGKLPEGQFGLTLSATGTGAEPTVALALDLRGLEVAGLPPMSADIDGRLEYDAFAAEGRLRDARTQLVGVSLGGGFDLGGLLTDTLGGAAGGAPGPASGTGEPRRSYLGDVSAEVDVIGLPVEILRHYTTVLDPLHGKLTGTVALSGTPSAPRLGADLGLRGGRLGDVDLTDFDIDLTVEEGRGNLSFWLTEKSGGTLALVAASPLDISFGGARTVEQRFGQPGLEGNLDGRDLPLGLITAFVDGARAPTGEFTASGRVGGTLLEPHPEIRLSLDGGAVCMEPLDVCYEQIEVQLRSTLEEVLLERFRMVSRPSRLLEAVGKGAGKKAERQVARAEKKAKGKAKKRGKPARESEQSPSGNGKVRKGAKVPMGWVEATGSLRLAAEERGEISLDLVAEDLWLSDTQQVRLRTDAKATVRGRYPDLRLRGRVTVRELKVEMGDELRRSAFPLERDPRLLVHRSSAESALTGAVERDRVRLTDHLDLRVHVTLDTNCWIFLDVSTLPGLGRIRPDIQLTGDLDLSMNRGSVYSDGEVRALRGHLTVLGKQFKVEEGIVTFTGSTPPDPNLDVTAVHRSRYGDITVVVGGRASTPELRFESTEYDDEADILSILLFGAPMDELRPGSSTDQGDELGILAAMGFARANQVLAKLFGHSAVDMINLETNPAGPGSFGIEVGKSISDRVFLITRYRFGGVQDEENVFEAQLEIQITRSLYIEMRYGDAGNGGLELFWKRKLQNPRPGKKRERAEGGE